MRRFLLTLFILVLPLRALAGDLMALANATMPHGIAETQAVAMAPDCEMHHSAVDAAHPGQDDGGHCECCALCLPMSQTVASASLKRIDVARRVAAASDASFLSAALGRSLRPPSS